MTLARAFPRELESGATDCHALVGNFILCTILGKKPALGDPIKSEQVRMTAEFVRALRWREMNSNHRYPAKIFWLPASIPPQFTFRNINRLPRDRNYAGRHTARELTPPVRELARW